MAAFSRALTGALAAALIICSAVSVRAEGQERAERIYFDIPAQPLSEAMAEFARQSRLSIGTSAAGLSALQSHGIRGTMPPKTALKRMLKGTGVTYSFVNPGAVMVMKSGSGGDGGAAASQKGALSVLPRRPVIDNLVVTAAKTVARTQTLPAAVSVVEGGTMGERGILRVSELSSQISGFMTTNVGPGRRKLFIRGLSDGVFTGQTRSTVGVYLDEAPMTYNDPYPDIGLVDIDRVEVLRGPQGTLYGTGAMSGVFRIIPNMPDLTQASGYVAGTDSYTRNGGLNGSVQGAFNLPLVDDKLGLRLSGSMEHDAGYIDDVRLKQKNVNKTYIQSARAILRWEPDTDWTVDLTAAQQHIDLNDTQYFVGALGRYNRDNYLAEPYKDLYRLGNLKVTGDLGWASFLSSTTLVQRENRARNDATLAVSDYFGGPPMPSAFDTVKDIDTFSQEMRLNSQDHDGLDWLLGLFFLDRQENTDFTLAVPGSGIGLPVGGVPGDTVFKEGRQDRVREMALFGNVSMDLGHHFRFGVGARLFNAYYRTSADLAGTLSGPEGHVTGRSAHTGVTPQVVLSYQPNNSQMIYFSGSAGYRNGGVNVNTPLDAILGFDRNGTVPRTQVFDADKMWNLELGLKQEWLDHRLRVNGAIFYVIWENIQTDQYLDNGLQYLLNAGDATNYGLELEVNALVSSNIQLAANIFWNAPTLLEGNSYLNATRGDRLPGIAEFAGGFSANYLFNIGKSLKGTVSVRYSYTGSSYLTFGDAQPSMGDYHVTNLRVEIGKDRWTIGAYVQNSWSETGNSFSFGNPFSVRFEDQVTPLQPLTAGVTFRVSY